MSHFKFAELSVKGQKAVRGNTKGPLQCAVKSSLNFTSARWHKPAVQQSSTTQLHDESNLYISKFKKQ